MMKGVVVMATYLDTILQSHREAARNDVRSFEGLLRDAAGMEACRGFRAALANRQHLGVISEVKRRSPSKGDLNADLDPAKLASDYQAGGASCLSVLTDVSYFGGSVADLRTARAACSLPVLRKDFTVSALDVVDTRLIGADCVLLIAAALDPTQLAEYHALAVEIGLDVLVEIHDEQELEHALAANATLIGVNQRDLVTFQVDHERAVRMASVIPEHAVKVAESGVRGRADAQSLRAAGYDAVLVGETLVTARDPAAALAELLV
jgi:indole-3-glycerol phosphate synthase